MRAAVVARYGPPSTVQIVERPDPIPGPGELLVRIRATTVSSGDARVRGFNVPALFWIPARLSLGLLRPRREVLGTEFAGVVASLGKGVTRFREGDAVFGVASFSKPEGTHAELLRIDADGLVEEMPKGMNFEEAGCMCFGLSTARHFLQKQANLRPGERVLIIGASGAVGCAAVQLAKHIGAHVTTVCSTQNIDLVRSLGADRVIDYTRQPFTSLECGQPRHDVIMDTIGATTPFACKPVLREGGRFIAIVMHTKTILQALASASGKHMRVIMGVDSQEPSDLTYFKQLAESGAYRSVIDRRWPLDDIAEAHRHVDSGRKRGNAVITMPG